MQITIRRQPAVLMFVMVAICFFSALALIYTKHESRKLFIELEQLTSERDELNIEWGQLQIEQSTWATHPRIESLARERLKLTVPRDEQLVVVVEPAR